MTHEKMESEYPLLVENSSRFELSYEVYPARIGEADEGPEQWFEIALYLELKECRPEPREGSLLLIGLADHLLQRVRSHAPFDLEMPPAYYSWHPASGDEDQSQPRMAIALSLVFSGVGSCPSSGKKPALLTQLRAELKALGIRRGKISGYPGLD
jgi:hypothetical protein